MKYYTCPHAKYKDLLQALANIMGVTPAEVEVKIFQIVEKLAEAFKTMLDVCPNKRVKHLMKYGKNDRVKMKNFYRALKLIGRELDG